MSVCTILAEPVPPLTPMGARMLACEARDGRTPITPDDFPPWLNVSDWWPWPVLAIKDDELHIIAVARAPAAPRGALRRLINAAEDAWLRPVMIEPLGAVVPALLAKWGWRRTVVGEGFHAREEWRPA